MNPKKLGGMANHRQEPWKVPLPQYIEELYLKRFKKQRPDHVRSIEQTVADKKRKQTERKEHRRQQQEAASSESDTHSSVQTDLDEGVDDSIPF